MCVLLTCIYFSEGSREIEHFNSYYISALKTTDAYKEWLVEIDREVTDMFTNMPTGHPFAGQLSVTDMKLRLAQYDSISFMDMMNLHIIHYF